MIKFKDSLNIERGIEFSLSFCSKYINLTLWAAKRTNGDTVQIPYEHLDELIDNLNQLKQDKNNDV